ncbi:DEAD/DEAH box helicase family protein [Gammaproteobacteria bacterium AB-CW1]|uniref:DEAD/DEAH box helicase family protein n=1 Tax=Natronospira elongata TaxID=3110268 RepID=A0AAP6JH04_9GAMM|nr:DEAD/DEAH box helicase family protein [Gammaproteobacteria bacterium AB-CW1]
MRYTLKDYQDDAVADVLDRLERARDDWKKRQSPAAFSLTATTGAGKTVMAAAVIEALFDGDADHDFEADPGAVVLWFTDDPALNEQTRFRLMAAADRLAVESRLKVVGNSFNQEKLEPGKVYFLNAQKLGKNSRLVRGAPEPDPDDTQQNLSHLPPPDTRAFTMWDTLRNTIEDENLTLYLILDEAHRGMKKRTKDDNAERATVVQRLINGTNGVPPVPVVWGISATVERFNQAMAQAEGRTTYPNVVVDAARVQESGLLKDDIRLEFPTETGQFDTVLLGRAARKVKEATQLWTEYAEGEGVEESVVPLLVVQVPNKPSDDLLLSAFKTIQEAWPGLEPDAMAHVFGEHQTIDLGGFTVPHVSPERVQDDAHIRVLFAKDAISTGWDCPRAEVLVSFRPAKDQTHITQLLGRMVRTPLARRVPGNDVLNSVECLLPHFNRSTASSVAEVLLGTTSEGDDGSGGTGGGEGRRVLFKPVDMLPNPNVSEAVWEAFDRVPSQTLPRKAARPVRRLAALAQALSRDGLRENAIKEAYEKLCLRLDGLATEYEAEVDEHMDAILEVHGETIVAGVSEHEVLRAGTFVELADDRAVEAEFRDARRILTPELAKRYADHIATDDYDGLFDAHVKVSGLARIEDVPHELDRTADKLAREWFAEYRKAIKKLSDERQAAYAEIKGMSRDPQEIGIQRPRTRTESAADGDGNAVETRAQHLMSDEAGEFPIGSLNEWEVQVLDSEMKDHDFRAWYRNPSRASEDALAIAYCDAQDNWRRMCPDFLFFHGDDDDIKVSIVDPHGHHFADALYKLRGLASFSEELGDAFHRIEAVARMEDETLRVLDLKDQKVREAIDAANEAKALYSSGLASDYL